MDDYDRNITLELCTEASRLGLEGFIVHGIKYPENAGDDPKPELQYHKAVYGSATQSKPY